MYSKRPGPELGNTDRATLQYGVFPEGTTLPFKEFQ